MRNDIDHKTYQSKNKESLQHLLYPVHETFINFFVLEKQQKKNRTTGANLVYGAEYRGRKKE